MPIIFVSFCFVLPCSIYSVLLFCCSCLFFVVSVYFCPVLLNLFNISFRFCARSCCVVLLLLLLLLFLFLFLLFLFVCVLGCVLGSSFVFLANLRGFSAARVGELLYKSRLRNMAEFCGGANIFVCRQASRRRVCHKRESMPKRSIDGADCKRRVVPPPRPNSLTPLPPAPSPPTPPSPQPPFPPHHLRSRRNTSTRSALAHYVLCLCSLPVPCSHPGAAELEHGGIRVRD